MIFNFLMPSSLFCEYPHFFDPPFGSYFGKSNCLLLLLGACSCGQRYLNNFSTKLLTLVFCGAFSKLRRKWGGSTGLHQFCLFKQQWSWVLPENRFTLKCQFGIQNLLTFFNRIKEAGVYESTLPLKGRMLKGPALK